MSSTLRSVRLSAARCRSLAAGPSHAPRSLKIVNARYNSTLTQDPKTGELAKLPDIEVRLVADTV